ncbi:FecR family protein [Chitinophaga arvensicola]|uniref:FecR protein n=1 Tax=Chitinophaga arvensicola TaxID=29529 RepID=A0A1I0RQC5_9BACT|nr:FecR family protein [Chitinophaga arvensicola]SEW43480.1 FecR protein [Chitinophaga arvensicola]
MDRQQILYLLELHCEGKLSAVQSRELSALLRDTPEDELLEVLSELTEQQAATPYEITLDALQPAIYRVLQTDKSQEAVTEEAPGSRKTLLRPLLRWSWAAAVLALIAIAGWWWQQQHRKVNTPVVALNDIAPGRSGAVLTLANGQQLVLDSLRQGVIATQQGTTLLLKEGQLAYEGAGAPEGDVAWNVLTTPAGRQFNIVLPDGTRVWLNAASSIRYPAVFNGREREVTVNGEAYFEVAANAQQPFRVNVNDRMKVAVLGTAFNISSYVDDPDIRATLLTGSVRVNDLKAGNTEGVLLQPGQQAQLDNHAALRVAGNVATDQVIAWKNGFFDFNQKSLRQVAGQIGRWYDVEVVYDKNVRDVELYGKISREVKLSDMLKLLETTGLHFRLEGNRRLLVLP